MYKSFKLIYCVVSMVITITLQNKFKTFKLINVRKNNKFNLKCI